MARVWTILIMVVEWGY